MPPPRHLYLRPKTESDKITKRAGTYVPRDKRKLPQAETGAVPGVQRAKVDNGTAVTAVAAGTTGVVAAAQLAPVGPIGDGEWEKSGVRDVRVHAQRA